jgi:hypothetical protein
VAARVANPETNIDIRFKGKRGQVGVYTKQCNERRSKAMVISLATLPSVSILEPVVKHLGYMPELRFFQRWFNLTAIRAHPILYS